MRRDAVGQFQKGGEPLLFSFAKFFHILPTVSAAYDGTDGDSNDVNEQMTLTAVDSRVS